jgi:ribosomal RNA-processing protein 12
MTQDLLILLLPHLSQANTSALFHLCLSAEVLGCKDNGIQKRGYKILAKIVESEQIEVDAEAVLQMLDELGDGLLPAAKKVYIL